MTKQINFRFSENQIRNHSNDKVIGINIPDEENRYKKVLNFFFGKSKKIYVSTVYITFDDSSRKKYRVSLQIYLPVIFL